MFYRCAAPAAAGARVAARAGKRKPKSLTVDIHCHYLSARAEAVAAPHFSIDKEPTLAFATDLTRKINQAQKSAVSDKMSDAALRLAEMDARGIDIQAISPAPTQYYYWLSPELGRETCRLINDEIAALAAGHPDRFVGMGTVPLQDAELAVAEMRALRQGTRPARHRDLVPRERRGAGQRTSRPFFARGGRTRDCCSSCIRSASPRASACPSTISTTSSAIRSNRQSPWAI